MKKIVSQNIRVRNKNFLQLVKDQLLMIFHIFLQKLRLVILLISQQTVILVVVLIMNLKLEIFAPYLLELKYGVKATIILRIYQLCTKV